MIQKIKITTAQNRSLEIDLLNPKESGITIYKIDGLNPPEATINMQNKATISGSVVTSTNVDYRNIVIGMTFTSTKYGEKPEDIRRKIYRFFQTQKEVKIELTDETGLYSINGYIETNPATQFSSVIGSDISILCPSVYFVRNYQQIIDFSNVKPNLEFPYSNESLTENETILSTIEYNSDKYMYYEGSVDSGFLLKFHAFGEIGDITVYNQTTNDKILISDSIVERMTGKKISSGDILLYDTRNNQNSLVILRDGILVNIINAIVRPITYMYVVPGDNLFVIKTEFHPLLFSVEMEIPVLLEGL